MQDHENRHMISYPYLRHKLDQNATPYCGPANRALSIECRVVRNYMIPFLWNTATRGLAIERSVGERSLKQPEYVHRHEHERDCMPEQ
jgi:hypothetical protein